MTIRPGNGSYGVRTISSYYRVIQRATQINPPVARYNILQGTFLGARDQLPQDNSALNISPGTVFSMITLSGEVADIFITDELARPVANRIAFRGVPTTGTAVNTGSILTDSVVSGVIISAAKAFYRRDAYPEEIQAGIEAHNKTFEKIGNPTAADNRRALLVIITGMLSSFDMIQL